MLIEADVAQPGELGTYVVHREGSYPFINVPLAR